MALRRGNLATVVLQGDYGKPRPALVIQANRFAELGAVVILPITSTIVDAPLLRLNVDPSSDNELITRSQIMLDKPMTVSTDKIGAVFGHLDDATMVSVNRSLALILGLAG